MAGDATGRGPLALELTASSATVAGEHHVGDEVAVVRTAWVLPALRRSSTGPTDHAEQ